MCVHPSYKLTHVAWGHSGIGDAGETDQVAICGECGEILSEEQADAILQAAFDEQGD